MELLAQSMTVVKWARGIKYGAEEHRGYTAKWRVQVWLQVSLFRAVMPPVGHAVS